MFSFDSSSLIDMLTLKMKRKSPDSSSLAIELVGKIGQKFDGTNKW
jgi:hypothetical protein